MKSSLGIAATLAATALAHSSAQTAQLARTQTAFDLTVNLPYAKTAPLFGPEGERVWAGEHWNPKFLYPQPAHDEQGAVFTIQHGTITATWVNTLFDVDARHFQYAYFMPGIMVTTIDVRFAPANETTTGVHVVYTRTALTPDGNAQVTEFTARDRTAAQDWQQAIDAYLSTSDHH